MSIELQNIAKTFTERNWRTLLLRKRPAATRALQDVSFRVKAGEIFGLLGPNGAGKTTLIKILATLILPDDGSASICGDDLIRHPGQVRHHIGLVNTSERSFYWRLTGRQNLSFFAALWNYFGAEMKARVQEMLKLVGLAAKADLPFMKYSSGQQQQLALARTLLPGPRVLLMDEPTRSLDPVAAAGIRKFVRQTLVDGQGKTVLWCTHNLQEAGDICDRLAIIHKGHLAASGSVKEIQSIMAAESSYRFKIDQWKPELADVQNWPPTKIIRNNGYIELELKTEEDHVPALLEQLVNAGINVYCCTRQEAGLEDAFEKCIHRRDAKDAEGF